MANDVNCEKLREIGAELALGVLPGRERAAAVAHLDRCADCREYIGQLTLVGDRLIGLLPEREPPVGFEARVAHRLAHDAAHEARGRSSGLASHQGVRSRARRARLRIAAVASAFVVAVGFAGWAVGTAVQEVTASPPAAVETEDVLVGDLTSPGGCGQPVGEIYAHPGKHGWIFMSVALTDPGTRYNGKVTCLFERTDGTTVPVGAFLLSDGRGSWGMSAAVDAAALSGARIESADGTVLARAQLQTGQVVTPKA